MNIVLRVGRRVSTHRLGSRACDILLMKTALASIDTIFWAARIGKVTQLLSFIGCVKIQTSQIMSPVKHMKLQNTNAMSLDLTHPVHQALYPTQRETDVSGRHSVPITAPCATTFRK